MRPLSAYACALLVAGTILGSDLKTGAAAAAAFQPSSSAASSSSFCRNKKDGGRTTPAATATATTTRIRHPCTPLAAVSELLLTSPEPIHAAFSVATFLPQPFWLLMILLPNWGPTKKIMGGLEVPLLCSLVHLLIVGSSFVTEGTDATAPLVEFNDVFDPFGDPQRAFMGMVSRYPNFVAEEWSHVLTWDLFVGRWIWIDGLRRGVFTAHSVLFCNLIGPPGLLLHWLTCALYGKPIVEPSEKEEIEQL